jgi:probable rRNA maturation factor
MTPLDNEASEPFSGDVELPFELVLSVPSAAEGEADLGVPEAQTRRGVALAWATLEARGEAQPLSELSITYLDDDEILALNRAHLKHDWVPDVLSFTLEAGEGHRIGDLYIGLAQAARQAAEHGVTTDEELVRLAVHGTLHVLGLDHPESAEDRAHAPMMQIQESVVRRMFP